MDINNLELPSNRKFGLFFSFIFSLCSLYFYIKFSKSLFITFLLISVLLLLITIFNDKLLLPFNKLWMRLGMVIGKVITPIIMGIIFFGLFTPISIIMKIFGRDELNLKNEKHQSYWKKRSDSSSSISSFKNQF